MMSSISSHNVRKKIEEKNREENDLVTLPLINY